MRGGAREEGASARDPEDVVASALSSAGMADARGPVAAVGADGEGVAADFVDRLHTHLRATRLGWLFDVSEEYEVPASVPVLSQLDVDVSSIARNLRCVLLPVVAFPTRSAALRKPDFWGPCFVVLLYALLVGMHEARAAVVTFAVWMAGSWVVYVAANALGSEMPYPVVLGITGYSVLPLCFASLALVVVPYFAARLAVQVSAVLWASASAAALLRTRRLERRRMLVLYPLLLLNAYFVTLHVGA